MLKIDVIAVSRVRNGAEQELLDNYQKRIQWQLHIHEVESKQTHPEKSQEEEAEKILKKLNNQAIIIALDERGKDLKSIDFAKKLENYKHSGHNHIQFIIGGADGLTQDIRDRADLLLSFGKQTWPHLLARVMLLEQIYRAQQILAGHPYHRE